MKASRMFNMEGRTCTVSIGMGVAWHLASLLSSKVGSYSTVTLLYTAGKAVIRTHYRRRFKSARSSALIGCRMAVKTQSKTCVFLRQVGRAG